MNEKICCVEEGLGLEEDFIQRGPVYQYLVLNGESFIATLENRKESRKDSLQSTVIGVCTHLYPFFFRNY